MNPMQAFEKKFFFANAGSVMDIASPAGAPGGLIGSREWAPAPVT
jgi:hypothetical protein